MSAISNLIIGIGGCGILATIAYLYTSYVNKKSDNRETGHNILQKIGLEKITKIEEKQVPIIKKIEESELISEETKKKIKEVKEEANKKVVEILKTESFEELSKKEDKLW